MRATYPPTHPNQPDLGFLLGLKSLCAALKTIWSDEVRAGRVADVDPSRADEPLRVSGDGVFDRIFGSGASSQGLGEGPGPDDVWDLKALKTA